MQRKSLAAMTCPVAQSLERVGEWWSMLIMRDALNGITRFDALQKNLGIAPNMLTRRLNSLVEGGLLEKRRYQDNPPRYEYLPTACGQDFRPVLLALLDWGNRHFAEDGCRVVIRDRVTGEVAEPLMIDRRSGRPLTDPAFERVYLNEPGQD